MYELQLRDKNDKVYSVSDVKLTGVLKKMSGFITKKYQIKVQL
jgi:hypothetical protein